MDKEDRRAALKAELTSFLHTTNTDRKWWQENTRSSMKGAETNTWKPLVWQPSVPFVPNIKGTTSADVTFVGGRGYGKTYAAVCEVAEVAEVGGEVVFLFTQREKDDG